MGTIGFDVVVVVILILIFLLVVDLEVIVLRVELEVGTLVVETLFADDAFLDVLED